jgi:hypothetical protein
LEELMKTLSLFATAVLIAVAAPRQAMANAIPATPALDAAATSEGCSKCSSGMSSTGGGSYSGYWSLSGVACNPGSAGCATCEPTCMASGTIGGTWSEVSEWYEDNSCESWSCISDASPSPDPLEEQSADEVFRTIQESHGRLAFNEKRGSVQIYDCGGVVAANVSLRSDVARSLAALIAAQ